MTPRLPRLPSAHLVAFALCAGLSASLVVRSTGWPLVLGAAACGAAAILVASDAGRVVAIAAAVALAGLWWGGTRLDDLDGSTLEARIGAAGPARVEVTGPARAGTFALRVPIRVRSFGRILVDERARLELPLGRAPPQGTLLDVVATVREPRRADGADAFDERAYLRRHGVHVVLRASSYRVVGRRGGIGSVADRLRAAVAAALETGLHGERLAVVAGVVLGEDERLADALQDDFRASGLYHLLAVSGQNVAYVVFGTLLAAWLLGLPRLLAHVAALAAVLGYVLAVGWQPSVVRAGVAGCLASLAWLAARPADRWYFLLVGAAVLLAANPYSLLEPGFQLSFAAVAAIFVLVPRFERRLEGYPVHPRLAAVVAVAATCGIVTAPVLWLHFGAVPVYSVLANAVAAPVVAPLLGGGLLCAAVAPVSASAAAGLAWGTGWLAAYLAWCARAAAALPYAELTSGPALLIALAAPALGLVVARIERRRAARGVALATALALVVVGWGGWPGESDRPPPPEGLRVTFLDVGQGDATLVEVPQGAILVDQGPPEANVARQLDALGVERLHALVLTHPQRDHVGGAVDVLEATDVDVVLEPALPADEPHTRAALAAARREPARIVVARRGQLFRLGRLRIQVLWPDGPGLRGADPNDRAIVLVLTYGEIDVLLPADAESDATLPLRPPPVEVLKVAHHGSADEGLPRLLERTRPRVAVISSGEGNSYGHPAPSTVASLAATPGLAVYRTDRDGRVTVETDGVRFTVREER